MILFSIVYGLIITNIILIDHSKGTSQAKQRVINNFIMAFLTLFCIIGFELRQARVEKWDYFKDFNNWNDMAFIVIFVA